MDLSLFVQNYLGINNIQVTYSKNTNLTNNTNHKFIKPVKSNFFKYYFLFLVITSSFFLYFILENKTKTNSTKLSIQNNMNKFKKDREFYSLTKMILILYEKAKDYNVVIDSIVMKNSLCLLSIQTTNKDVVYKYFEDIPNIGINNIFFDKELKRYKIDASFKLPRR